jgi:hypothetical protein
MRAENRRVDVTNLCVAECVGAAFFTPFACSEPDRFEYNATDESGDMDFYNDCINANYSPGCESDYELHCNTGVMFDSKCEADCSVPGGFASKAVKNTETGFYECHAFCTLSETRSAKEELGNAIAMSGDVADGLEQVLYKVLLLEVFMDTLIQLSALTSELEELTGNVDEFMEDLLKKSKGGASIFVGTMYILSKGTHEAVGVIDKVMEAVETDCEYLKLAVIKPFKAVVGTTESSLDRVNMLVSSARARVATFVLIYLPLTFSHI